MSEQTFELVSLIVMLASFVVAAYIAPVVKKYLQNKLVEAKVKDGVYSAQQLHGDLTGPERKEFALSIVKGFLDPFHIAVTDAQLSALIESAVYAMKLARGDAEAKAVQGDSDVRQEQSNTDSE